MNEEILIRKEGMAGRITLNRPGVLNTLTATMVDAMTASLRDWRDDPFIQSIIIDGAGEKAFCAGGDVRSFYDAGPDNTTFGKRFWREEYTLNAAIASYPKPYVALMDGIVMGGGVGVSAHGSHRIVTERTSIAMPETAIGLIPDVGGTFLLSRSPDDLGVYLGLTGTAMGASDAIHAGFADHFVKTEQVEDLISELTATPASEIGEVVSRMSSDPGAPVLRAQEAEIVETFRFGKVEDCLTALREVDNEWSRKLVEKLSSRSPLALKLTLAAIRNAATLQSLEEALNVEYRLTSRLLECGEFLEGVRALIIDKDRRPTWNPAHLNEVSQKMVANFMEPLPSDKELSLNPPAVGANV